MSNRGVSWTNSLTTRSSQTRLCVWKYLDVLWPERDSVEVFLFCFLILESLKSRSQPRESDGMSWHGNVLSIQSHRFKTDTVQLVLTHFSNTV